MSKSQIREEIEPVTGRRILTAPGPRVPYAYVVKCAGGCGADMLVPITYRDPDGTVHEGDPDEPKWCMPCGARKFMGVDIGPGYGDAQTV